MSTMKAIQVHEFIDDLQNISSEAMSLSENVAVPTPKKNEMLVRVLACSISPGDVIKVHGNLIFLHPEKFPFIPCMDICGVVENPNGHENFKIGDIVVAAKGMESTGGMAEYMTIPHNEAVLKPQSVPVLEAAASSSAITARNAVLDHVRKGHRVLILGGSGGVGTAAITMAKKHAGASFVATTSTQAELCKNLGADVVINYQEENWWERKWEAKFDVIIDTVGGGNFTAKAEMVLKPGKQGGKFIAVTGDDTMPDCRTWWKAIKFFANMPLRPLYSWWRSRTIPAYVALMPYDYPQGRKQVLDMMEAQELQIKIDDRFPEMFTLEGVKRSFGVIASGHSHGKVVVSMEEVTK